MVKNINEKGFTLAEALISMLLVAVIAAGIITALMATKRAIIAPSNREDMIMAIEKASVLLEQSDQAVCGVTGDDRFELTPTCVLATGSNCHKLDCLLPNSCYGGYFVYKVSEQQSQSSAQGQKIITFKIQCGDQTI